MSHHANMVRLADHANDVLKHRLPLCLVRQRVARQRHRLRVECSKCGRFGRYPLHRLIDQHGGNGTIIDWLDALTADCPRKRAPSVGDRCQARCPDLPTVV